MNTSISRVVLRARSRTLQRDCNQHWRDEFEHRSAAVLKPVTEMIIVKYPHHDRIEYEVCTEHAAQTALAYGRQGQVLAVVTYPYQSEGWFKPRP